MIIKNHYCAYKLVKNYLTWIKKSLCKLKELCFIFYTIFNTENVLNYLFNLTDWQYGIILSSIPCIIKDGQLTNLTLSLLLNLYFINFEHIYPYKSLTAYRIDRNGLIKIKEQTEYIDAT